MRSRFGFLLIFTAIPALLAISTLFVNELRFAEAQQYAIEEKIIMPDVETPLPVRMTDREGTLFSEEYVNLHEPYALDDIPYFMQQLFLLNEDEEFYNHIGFDLSAITRAFISNAQSDDIQQGGSTITQQLVRMRYLTTEKSYERKITELFYAYELEKTHDKDVILEMYLNEMYFSNLVYGVGAAAQYYFQKDLPQLSKAEMAFLAAIPNNPSMYNPLKNFDATKKRQELLIDGLVRTNFITADEATQFKAEAITLNVKEKAQQHPMYTTYVLQEFEWLVAEQEGFAQQLKKAEGDTYDVIYAKLQQRVRELLDAGITIHTALDTSRHAQDVTKMDRVLHHYSALQGAGVVIDNQSREIVSLYAGKDYEKFDFNRAYQAIRQPGSAFKPLAVYGPYIEETGAYASQTVNAAPICVGNFCPQNYGGYTYGRTDMTSAFRWSHNTAALRLFYTMGIDTAFSYIDRFHFLSLSEEDRNYATSLGGLTYGVTPVELADAYASFSDGSYVRAHAIRSVKNKEGELLYEWPAERDTIWSAHTVAQMKKMLADVAINGTGEGVYSTDGYVGVKTGTTNRYHDFWLAGLSNNYTVSVWIGYDEPASMERLEKRKIHHQLFNILLND
ncbi:transglycosylase domain-containing protein [Caryophanon tenue]|uniref:Penicillin-binding protein n=1 Tax=Caryophanon tenue TaxID=33978 RepID=A0A1C0YEI6_9BACL|nr:transglycosylase domain-containing protein [Caryophanon tenue]OCS85570.1 penicillin-binding protein [Caryophanon tenue]